MNKRQKQLERKLRSYRSARFGSVFLAVVAALVLLMMIVMGQTRDDLLAPIYAAAFVWPAVAYICHLKIKLLQVELSKLSEDAGKIETEPNT